MGKPKQKAKTLPHLLPGGLLVLNQQAQVFQDRRLKRAKNPFRRQDHAAEAGDAHQGPPASVA
ncbi:MAG: hypothetical protein H7338_19800 [Candidatus Sericytochromatia bacterium]|nr:hypothetical protein [Candidatus Sericytochromatia bacterium]